MSANCTHGLYLSPQMGSTIDSLNQQLNVSWDSTCLSTKEIDIYLYAPQLLSPRIHVWETVALSRHYYQAQLMPRWWNSTQSQRLQIIIVPSGDPPFASTFPAGPVFTATYASNSSSTPAAADTTIIDSGITRVDDLAGQQTKKSMSGRAAAGVLIPLIFIALGFFAYVRWKRRRQHQKRKAWTEKVDKRMSTISTDWKSVSAAGAQAAIRNSMAVQSRNSSFSFGAIRPSSSFNIPDVDADDEKKNSAMRTGTGVGLRNPNALSVAGSGRNSTTSTRVSRVSFAPDPRVSRVSFADSTDSRKNIHSRAFHSAYVPPVPALPEGITSIYVDRSQDKDKITLSPTQTAGALSLSPEDIRVRVGASTNNNAGLDDEVYLALSMMRTGNMEASGTDDFLLPSHPQVPEPTYSPTTASIASAFPPPPTSNTNDSTMTVPTIVLSPDEMLRAYAERKKGLADAAKAGKIGAPLRLSAVPSLTASSTTNGSISATPPRVKTVASIHDSGMKIAYNQSDTNGLVLPPPTIPATYYQPSSPLSTSQSPLKNIKALSITGKGSKGIEGGKALIGKVKSIGKKRKSMNPFLKPEPDADPEAFGGDDETGTSEGQYENPGEAYVAALEAEAAENEGQMGTGSLGDEVIGAYPYAYDQQQYYGQYAGYDGQYYGNEYQYGEAQEYPTEAEVQPVQVGQHMPSGAFGF